MGELERWLPVKGYEGLYDVSDAGRIRSNPRVVKRCNSGPYTTRTRILRPGISNEMPYPTLRLTDAVGHQRTHYVHVMVLEAFVGSRPPGFDACHGDGCSTNNGLGNLRWDTRTANHADKNEHGTSPRGERHPQAKLSEQDVLQMRRMRASGRVYRDIAADCGVSVMAAHRAINGKNWGHIK
jgi:hypothetical protein